MFGAAKVELPRTETVAANIPVPRLDILGSCDFRSAQSIVPSQQTERRESTPSPNGPLGPRGEYRWPRQSRRRSLAPEVPEGHGYRARSLPVTHTLAGAECGGDLGSHQHVTMTGPVPMTAVRSSPNGLAAALDTIDPILGLVRSVPTRTPWLGSEAILPSQGHSV